MAELHIALGEFDKAFEWIEKAILIDLEAREAIRQTSDYDPIRGDPRFRALVGDC